MAFSGKIIPQPTDAATMLHSYIGTFRVAVKTALPDPRSDSSGETPFSRQESPLT